ncbi:MAG: hypothetical protein HY976_02390 [Candidatus Kerfeldbacteria bacterium]|nr:hypothetical protein [Candidatus Kerfeldbacteria bacterium]
MALVQKITKDLKNVNIHMVNGDVEAINFLKNADYHWVEGLFLRAKMLGRMLFEYHGQQYQLLKNRNMTYTVELVPESPLNLESL